MEIEKKYEKIGEALRESMLDKEITKYKLEKELDMSVGSYNTVLRDVRVKTDYQISKLFRLAEYLDVDLILSFKNKDGETIQKKI